MLYTIIILTTMLISYAVSVSIALTSGTFTLLYAFLAPTFALTYLLVMMGIWAVIVRLVPKSWYNHARFVFRVSKKELKFYDHLKIKKWKDKVPEHGRSAGFSKKNIESLEIKYIEKFLRETCYGEVLHALCGIWGFSVLFFFARIQRLFVWPIVIVNLFLHTLPCLIQRYNRHRLAIVLRFKNRSRALPEETTTANIKA